MSFEFDKGEALKSKITIVLLASLALFLTACPSGPQHTDPVDKPVPNSSSRPDADRTAPERMKQLDTDAVKSVRG